MIATFITSPNLLAQHFHKAAPLLQPVIDQAARGEFTVEDIRNLTEQGRVITALVEEDGEPVMAMAFEFVYYPRMLAVNVMAMGGHGLADVRSQFWDAFKDWCRSAGATVIEASCSDAMARLLSRNEFKSVYRVVRAEL